MDVYSILDENVKMDTGFCEAGEKHRGKHPNTEFIKKFPAKFREASSVRVDGLCIGCQQFMRSRKEGNSNLQDLIFMTLYITVPISK